MNTNNEQVLELYNNPLVVQSTILNDQQQRITDGVPVIDANNVASHLMEAFSVISSDIVRSTLREIDTLHAVRAQVPEDLYKHMSDFDYVGLFSSPSSMFIELTLSKDQLIKSAESFNSNYKKVTIPRNSVFRIDRFDFTLYHDIDIRVNKSTNTFIVTYNTEVSNPLNVIVRNTIEHRIRDFHGTEVISILIPIYQFLRTEIFEDVTSDISFVKKYDFTDKFYAARIFGNSGPNGEFEELRQTLSDSIYDPESPTAKLLVDDEFNTITITIPQIYLTNNLVGNRIKIDILTTVGAVDADLTNLTQESISATFTITGDPVKDKFTTILNRPEVIVVNPISDKLVGGSDGIDFFQLRQRVIHDSFTEGVLLTPIDITNHFSDKGFRVERFRDGITDRIYLAYKEITDQQSVIVPSANLRTIFTKELMDNSPTINGNTDESYTILPSTIYKYNDVEQTATLLPDPTIFDPLSRQQLVDLHNDEVFVFNPFHIRIDTNDRYPLAYAYDLTDPKINNVEFVGENINITSQVSIFFSEVTSLDEGVGGFNVDLHLARSNDLADILTSDVRVILYIKNTPLIFQEAIYDREENDRWVFRAHLTSDYSITQDHAIGISSMVDSSGSTSHHIPLDSEVSIGFFVNNSVISIPPGSSTDIVSEIASDYPGFTPVAEQSFNLVLGRLIDEAFTSVGIGFTDEVYAVYGTDLIATYNQVIYDRDINGDPIYSVDGGGNVTLTMLHDIGDIIYDLATIALTSANIASFYGWEVIATGDILDASNEATYINTTEDLRLPVLLHSAGDPVFVDGARVLSTNGDRQVEFSINLLQIGVKVKLSEQPNHVDFLDSAIGLLRSYFDAVSTSRPLLIEETEIYFQSLRSLGTSTFRQGLNNQIRLNLELSVGLKLYVFRHVFEDLKAQQTITDTVISLIDDFVKTGTFSATELATEIVEVMPTLVKFVDVLGVNDQQTLQTLINDDPTVVPNLKQELFIDDDGSINIRRALDIEFIAVDIV